jgi:hypothetical protein
MVFRSLNGRFCVSEARAERLQKLPTVLAFARRHHWQEGCSIPGPGFLAHVLVSKYADHLPLYRQAQIFAREGLDMDRSTLAGWVGKSAALLEPLANVIKRHVLSGQAIFADDTPVKMLAPGNGKTKTARFWAYDRDERPWGSDALPAAWYQFTPDRKGIRPSEHLKEYQGWMHADGYSRHRALVQTHSALSTPPLKRLGRKPTSFIISAARSADTRSRCGSGVGGALTTTVGAGIKSRAIA